MSMQRSITDGKAVSLSTSFSQRVTNAARGICGSAVIVVETLRRQYSFTVVTQVFYARLSVASPLHLSERRLTTLCCMVATVLGYWTSTYLCK